MEALREIEEDFFIGLLNKQGIYNMLSDVCIELGAEYDEIYMSNKHRMPDKSLVFAVLERAVLDLFISETDMVNLKYKKQAINWFLSPARAYKEGYSFLQTVQYLDISGSTTCKLMELARSIQYKSGKYYELYTRYRSGCYRRLCRNN